MKHSGDARLFQPLLSVRGGRAGGLVEGHFLRIALSRLHLGCISEQVMWMMHYLADFEGGDDALPWRLPPN